MTVGRPPPDNVVWICGTVLALAGFTRLSYFMMAHFDHWTVWNRIYNTCINKKFQNFNPGKSLLIVEQNWIDDDVPSTLYPIKVSSVDVFTVLPVVHGVGI